MKKKLNSILLIDDDESTNFLHEIIINQAEITKKVVAKQSGASALSYLATQENGDFPRPDLIFLDINMPGMNGWEFLDEYSNLPLEQQGNFVVVMLTTSLHPEDEAKARGRNEIDDFKNKPLTVEMLQEVIKSNFPDYV